ncbi:hypothetical protein [Thermotoga sp. KOL6]|uniref:hypothetical protein n=1 Tax=Thermotoga sp. KOL6 TaxID=126741 RepID=UPI000C783E56|nr:hypothetical protein [Thermotoga sp. KOL6]PLV60376.1 hypothetical protein AS005_03605 [Thermotoga sp. KOL6]
MKYVTTLLLFVVAIALSVPVLPDYDYLIRLENTEEFYSKIKELPLFEFLLSGERVGFEQTIRRWVETRLEDPSVFYRGLSKEIVISGKGDVKDLLSFDVNSLLSTPEKLTNGFIAFRTDSPQKFVESLAKIKASEYYEKNGVFVIEGATHLFSKVMGEYVLVSPNRKILEEVQDQKMDLAKAPVAIHVRDLNLFGKIGEATLKAEMKPSHLTIEVSQKAPPFSVSKKEDMGQLPYLGDLFAFTSSHEILKIILNQIFKNDDVEEFYHEFFSNGESVTFLTTLYETPKFVFLIGNKTLKGVESFLISRGAERVGDEWQLPVRNTVLHFFEYKDKLVVSSMKRAEYVQAVNRRRLENHPTFAFLEKESPEEVFLEMFLDLNSFINKILGFSPKSSLLLIGYIENGLIKYRLEVM